MNVNNKKLRFKNAKGEIDDREKGEGKKRTHSKCCFWTTHFVSPHVSICGLTFVMLSLLVRIVYWSSNEFNFKNAICNDDKYYWIASTILGILATDIF